MSSSSYIEAGSALRRRACPRSLAARLPGGGTRVALLNEGIDSMMAMMAVIQQRTDDGLTIGEIVGGIPHDVPALFTYALLAVAGYVVWRAGRGSKTS
jgi:hypothetical protein